MSDYQFITERGVIVPDTADSRQRVIELFRSAFGNDIDTDPSTPSGLLITMFTEQRDAVARNNAALANQINPELSTGVFLDGLFGFTGGQRNPATRSIINGVTLTGDAGTIVPAGTIARSLNGDQFQSVAQVTLNAPGTATVDFIAIEYGPIECGAHELQTIATSVLGLIGIDNNTGAVVGRKAENDSQVRRRRRRTLAIQSMSTPEAIRSRLGNIETVRSHQFLENYTDAPVVKRGITLKPNSIWVCVEGGTDEEIATAIHDSKTMGAGYNGAVQYDIVDQRSLVPYPVLFDRPREVALLIRVTVRASSLDVQNLIPDLVMSYVNGELEGDVSFVVGVDVSPWEISGAINQQEPLISVQKVELSLVGSNVWSSDVYARYRSSCTYAEKLNHGGDRMSRELDLNVNLLRSILWQYENADKLKALVTGQQEWINKNHTKFWKNWIRDVFNLRTANAFGLAVWARILNVPLTIEREENLENVFGFGVEHANFNNGNFGVQAGAIDNVSVEQARKMLLARYFTLIYSPTVPNINMILEVLFGGGAVYVVDSLDMRYSTYTFDGMPDYRTRDLLKNVDFLPRPAAVGVDFTILPDDAFGFGEHHLNFENGGFTERRYI